MAAIAAGAPFLSASSRTLLPVHSRAGRRRASCERSGDAASAGRAAAERAERAERASDAAAEPTMHTAGAVTGRLRGRAPRQHSPMFSRMTGSDVYLKAEYRQKTGSFKIRGAYYKVRSLSEAERRNGVVAASAGNHAQGVAYAASAEGIPCTIVMPQSASPAKVAATRGYGATVVLHGASYEESWAGPARYPGGRARPSSTPSTTRTS